MVRAVWVLLLFFVSALLHADSLKSEYDLSRGDEVTIPIEKSLGDQLEFVAEIEVPVNQYSVPSFYLFLKGKKKSLVTLGLADHECTGAYEVDLDYWPNKNDKISHYFQNKIPWENSPLIRLIFNKKIKRKRWEHTIMVDNELSTVITYEPAKEIKLSGFGNVKVTGVAFSQAESNDKE